jgi:hypothetical protein
VCPLADSFYERIAGSIRPSVFLVRALKAARATAPRPSLHLEEKVMENIKLCL